jgi:outer membrane protein assembly factor BamB
VLWRQRSPRNRNEKLDHRNNPASPSPVLDEVENVYVFFGDFGLLSYDRSGRERWRMPLGPFDNLYGMGVSPLVAENGVFLVCDQQTGSFLIAVDKDTGQQLWKVDRPEATSGHSTPILYRAEHGSLELLVAGSFLLSAFDPANGEKLWWVRGLSFEMKSTPVMSRNMLFVNGYATPLNQPDKMVETEAWSRVLAAQDKNSDARLSKEELPDSPSKGFFPFVDLDQDGSLNAAEWKYYRDAMASKNAMLGIHLGGQGDMTDSNLKWEYHRSVSQLPSPLLYKDILYMIDDGGIATSFRPHTGEVIARSRIKGAIDKYFASPVAADDKIFLVSETCKVAVLKPDGSLEVLVVNDLESTCYATPALAQGRIYIRTTETLYAFGE